MTRNDIIMLTTGLSRKKQLRLIEWFDELSNKTCNTCKHSSYEIKFEELEFNCCYLVSNNKECKWESKDELQDRL